MEVRQENQDLQEEISTMIEFGTFRDLEVQAQNKIWAEEQKKLWTTQVQIMDKNKQIAEQEEKLILQNEKIEGLEEGICTLLELNKCLEKDKDRAVTVYEEAKRVLKQQCNIILHDEDITDNSINFEMVD